MSDSGTTPLPSTTTGAMNGDKLSGQLIIKAQLGDDIRKMMIHNEDLTLNELVLMMERVFTGKISNSDELTIKYLDDDGDKITLLNDSDLNVALHFHKLLRLFVFVNGKEPINNSNDNLKQQGNLIDTKAYRNELQDIRNSVQTILDRLQLSNNEVSTTASTVPPPAVASNTTREFDPFKHLNQQQQQQQQQQQPVSPDRNQSNSNHSASNEHPTAPAVEPPRAPTTDANQALSNQFQPMPTPHFTPAAYNPEQQTKTNIFGPPPTTFPGMPPLPNTIAPRFPPATTPNSSTPPTFGSTPSPPSAFLGQQTASPPQQSSFYGQQQATPPPQPGGFYAQQQAAFQHGPPVANFNPNNAFPLQTPSTSNSSPATINPSFVQPPPPMASQQPYGAYSPPNPYFNPVQQYPK
jgi:hypothetical protein